MEALWFLLAAVGLYFLSDRVLQMIETRVGRRLEQRSLIFFAILLLSAMVTFWLIRLLTGS
jgi:hypothetical protein